MLAFQANHGHPHGIEVKAFFNMPGILPEEGCGDGPIQDTIIVNLAPNIVSSMERVLNCFAIFDHNVSGKEAI